MYRPETLRTTSFRLAIGYTVVFVVSVLAIMGTAYLAATSEMRGIVRSSIDEDMDAFRSAFAKGGEDTLLDVFARRSQGMADDRFFLLAGPDPSQVLGNVPFELWRPGWQNRKVPWTFLTKSRDLYLSSQRNSDAEVLLFSYGERIGPFLVMAGRNSHILDETQEILIAALLWGCLAAALLALAGGYVVSIGPTRRVDEIAATTRQIVGGRLDLRLPVSKRRDEMDRLASDINVMLSRIQVLMESLRQVSTDIAHDLRTPLARLRQRLESVGRHARGVEDYQCAIDDAMTETDAILDTFAALLRIAQIEAGARKARFGPLDLSALANNVADVYHEVAIDAGHELRLDVQDGVEMSGDAELMTQALVNLVENSINHVEPPGRIVVSVRADEAEIVLEVVDDGPGIPETERENVFRRLYRLDRSRTTPGNGLGLALVAAIVELHGGHVVALDNAPGARMRATFRLDATGMAGAG